jgi:hypothetical protein
VMSRVARCVWGGVGVCLLLQWPRLLFLAGLAVAATVTLGEAGADITCDSEVDFIVVQTGTPDHLTGRSPSTARKPA